MHACRVRDRGVKSASLTFSDPCVQGDFGNARAAEPLPLQDSHDDDVGGVQNAAQAVGEEMVHGDRRYVAPEVLDFGGGEEGMGQWFAADIFSLGVSLYGVCLPLFACCMPASSSSFVFNAHCPCSRLLLTRHCDTMIYK